MFEQFRQIERKESLAQLFRNLKIAFVAALAVLILLSLLEYKVSDVAKFNEYCDCHQFSDWKEAITLNVLLLGYPIAAILLWRCRETFVVERFPIWLCISIIGSIISISLYNLTLEILDIETRFSSLGRGIIAAYYSGVLSFYVAPITAAFYYSPPIVKVLKQMWRNG